MNPLVRAAWLALSAPLAYALVEPHRLQVRRFDVEFEKLPLQADGLRLAHFSDLHCSAITSARVVRRVVEACNALRPDAVLLTGDYVSRRDSYSSLTLASSWAPPVMEYGAAVARELAALRAPEGVFAVPGNHDYSQGRFDAVAGLLREAGITTLVNRSVRLRDVLPLVGLDDVRAGRPHVRAACEGIAPHEAHVVLSHNPRALTMLAGRNCLLLSGHTHGGQVHLPGTRFRSRPSDMRHSPLFQGWYRAGATRLYVTPGVGSVHLPLRFRCPPEIALFTLRAR